MREGKTVSLNPSSGWTVKPLGELFGFYGGYSASRERLSTKGHPYLHYGDIHGSSRTFVDVCAGGTIPCLNVDLSRVSEKALLQNGDVVFVDASEDDEGASKHIVVRNSEGKTFISGLHTIIAKPKTDELDNLYKEFCFQTNEIKTQFKYYAVGTKVTGVNKTSITKILLRYPSDKAEQHAIAEALSDVDALIENLEKLIAKKKAIKQGAMQELLTGKRRLPGFDGEWVEKRIGDIGYCYSGLIGKTGKDFGCGKGKYITFLNILMNTVIDISILEYVNIFYNEQQNAVQYGDLFFNTSSETPEEVGMCAVLLNHVKNVYLNSFCFGFRLVDNSVSGLFLAYLFNSNVGRNIMSILAQGATRYNLSKVYFNNTSIYLPDFKEQTAIATVLSDMDNEIEALTAKLQKTKLIKQGMMQELLTGRKRIRKPEEKIVMFPVAKTQKTVAVPAGHNQQFDDAVMIAGIVNVFYSGKYLLGRKKVQKLLYLLRRHQDRSTLAFKKKAAGPYADEVRYKGGEPIARTNQYISTNTVKGRGTTFAKGKNIEKALEYIINWGRQGDIQWLVEKFLYKTGDELELLATVDMAACDLEEMGMPVSLTSVKHLIATNDEWKAKLQKTTFSDTMIAKAITDLNKLF